MAQPTTARPTVDVKRMAPERNPSSRSDELSHSAELKMGTELQSSAKELTDDTSLNDRNGDDKTDDMIGVEVGELELPETKELAAHQKEEKSFLREDTDSDIKSDSPEEVSDGSEKDAANIDFILGFGCHIGDLMSGKERLRCLKKHCDVRCSKSVPPDDCSGLCRDKLLGVVGVFDTAIRLVDTIVKISRSETKDRKRKIDLSLEKTKDAAKADYSGLGSQTKLGERHREFERNKDNSRILIESKQSKHQPAGAKKQKSLYSDKQYLNTVNLSLSDVKKQEVYSDSDKSSMDQSKDVVSLESLTASVAPSTLPIVPTEPAVQATTVLIDSSHVDHETTSSSTASAATTGSSTPNPDDDVTSDSNLIQPCNKDSEKETRLKSLRPSYKKCALGYTAIGKTDWCMTTVCMKHCENHILRRTSCHFNCTELIKSIVKARDDARQTTTPVPERQTSSSTTVMRSEVLTSTSISSPSTPASTGFVDIFPSDPAKLLCPDGRVPIIQYSVCASIICAKACENYLIGRACYDDCTKLEANVPDSVVTGGIEPSSGAGFMGTKTASNGIGDGGNLIFRLFR